MRQNEWLEVRPILGSSKGQMRSSARGAFSVGVEPNNFAQQSTFDLVILLPFTKNNKVMSINFIFSTLRCLSHVLSRTQWSKSSNSWRFGNIFQYYCLYGNWSLNTSKRFNEYKMFWKWSKNWLEYISADEITKKCKEIRQNVYNKLNSDYRHHNGDNCYYDNRWFCTWIMWQN